MKTKWIRTCQECGHEQEDNKPSEIMLPSYANRKCKKCKSESLDYGSYEKIAEGFEESL